MFLEDIEREVIFYFFKEKSFVPVNHIKTYPWDGLFKDAYIDNAVLESASPCQPLLCTGNVWMVLGFNYNIHINYISTKRNLHTSQRFESVMTADE